MQRISREVVRENAKVYMSRAGISMRELADRSGYARRTILQFLSGSG